MRENKISFEGQILKIERLAQGKEQKEVINGICSVSTLSKIERGKQKVDKDMLMALYKELGIEYETDKTFLIEMKEYIDEFFYEALYNLPYSTLDKLKENEKRLRYSPLALDYLIVFAFNGDISPLNILDSCVEFMNEKQLGRYYAIRRYEQDEVILDKRIKSHVLLQSSASLLNLMFFYWTRGEFKKVEDLINQGINIALEEGNTWTLAQIHILKGGIYSCFNREEYMIKEYEKAINFLTNTNWKDDLDTVYYNIGASYISLKNYDKAREYLNKSSKRNFYYYHKITTLEIEVGNISEAEKSLVSMESYLKEYDNREENSKWNDLDKQAIDDMTNILEIMKIKVKGNAESNPIYIRLLEEVISSYYKQGKYGYVIFNKNYLKEAYIKNRRYKEALELEEMISQIKSKTSF